MNTLILRFKKVTPLWLIVFALGCLALLPRAQAVSPPLDGDDTAQELADNTAIDADMLRNMMMLGNTAYGCHALADNAMGNSNTAIGSWALADNAMGNSNTAIGRGALADNAMGNDNTAIGRRALACSTGSNNIALGAFAGSYGMAGNNDIYIGNLGMMAPEDGQIRIGHPGLHTGTYIAGIHKAAVSGSPVVVSWEGKLGVTMSSAQFKEAIKPMGKASKAILALKPVTFHYKKDIDPDGIPQFGLVAEQVEKVNPDLVARDEEGKVYTVRYEAVNAMLLNEFLKEHRTVQEQQKEIDALKAELKEQRAFIQKVNDKVELNNPAPQTVLNNQ